MLLLASSAVASQSCLCCFQASETGKRCGLSSVDSLMSVSPRCTNVPELLSLVQPLRVLPQTRTDIGTLLIPDVTVSDSGTYMCVGSNSIGSNSAPIKVIVLKGETLSF